MCSIAATFTPSGSLVRHVAIDASRSAATSASARGSDVHGTSASAVVGAGVRTRNVTVVIAPSVPSEPMNRSIGSISGSAW